MPVQFKWTNKKGQPPRVKGYVETLEDHIALVFEKRGLGKILPPVDVTEKSAKGAPSGTRTRSVGKARRG